MKIVNVIGAGLAGCEASLFLANNGIKVNLYEMKPKAKTPAHKNDDFCELVCSNSLKSEDELTASGLLKLELKHLGSNILKIADECRVPSGKALAVDREKFAKGVTELIKSNENINVVCEEVKEIDESIPTIIATGPLTSSDLLENLKKYFGDDFYFYDAIAPIVSLESIDMSRAFWGNRYNKDNAPGDYLNCPMTKEEYLEFYQELINAKTVELKSFEKVFEACMAVEILGKRGEDALRYGPMKPVGFRDYLEEKPYAVVQLRKENLEGDMLNIVGFQTNLTFPEQKRVFSLIPALKNAEFIRYGVMHRNSYINAPKLLNEFSQLKEHKNIFIAGQLSGVEGYVESVASGLVCGYNMLRYINGKEMIALPRESCIGSIINYIISASEKDFQPMNANFGIMISPEGHYKNKDDKRRIIVDNAMAKIKEYKEKYGKYI